MADSDVQIHVHTTTDKNTIGYVEFMWQTMLKLANNKPALKLTIHCTGPKAVEAAKALTFNDSTQVNVVLVARPDWLAKIDQQMYGSYGHAACVENALKMITDNDIHIIVDSDTVVLAKGWDDYIRSRLLIDGVGTIGVTYEDVGGFSSGASKNQTYKRIPNAIWMAMKPGLPWHMMEARPSKDRPINIQTEEHSLTYNLPIGYSMLRDVGWQVPQFLRDNKISYDGLVQLKPTKNAVVLSGLSDYHEEYHADGEPFVAHHRGSLKNAYRSSGLSERFYKAIDRWLVAEDKLEQCWTLGEDNQLKKRQIGHGNAVVSIPAVVIDKLPTIQQSSGTTLKGWLKASLDGHVMWDRHKTSVPSIVNVSYEPNTNVRSLRLEGTVTTLTVSVPNIKIVPHFIVVRNALSSDVNVCVSDNKKTIVPSGKTWMLMIDVDGIIHVE